MYERYRFLLNCTLSLYFAWADGRFHFEIPESVPLGEPGPPSPALPLSYRGFLGVVEHFGQAEVVALEAVLVCELGLLDANDFFPRVHLVDSFQLFLAVLPSVGGRWRSLPVVRQFPRPFVFLKWWISDPVKDGRDAV